MRQYFDRALHVVLTGLHLILRAYWFIRRPKTFGAHAVALTPERRVILVRLRYASDWRLPGGGRSAGEAAVDAALRELREEIGMISHGEARAALDFEESVHCKRDSASLVVIRDVLYRPRWSWEVERICEADLDSLPPDLSPRSKDSIEALRPLL